MRVVAAGMDLPSHQLQYVKPYGWWLGNPCLRQMQYDLVVKVIADFVLSDQSDYKLQAQQCTCSLSDGRM